MLPKPRLIDSKIKIGLECMTMLGSPNAND